MRSRHTPVETIRTNTSPAFGPSSSISSTASGFLVSQATAAIVFIAIQELQVRCTGTRLAVNQGVRHPIFSAVATVWLVLLSAFEIIHFARGEPWPGYTHVVNYVSFFYVALFLTGCAYLVRYQMRRPVWPMIAFAAAIVHGVMIRVGGGWQGYVHLVSGVALMISGFSVLKYRIVREQRRDIYSPRKAA